MKIISSFILISGLTLSIASRAAPQSDLVRIELVKKDYSAEGYRKEIKRFKNVSSALGVELDTPAKKIKYVVESMKKGYFYFTDAQMYRLFVLEKILDSYQQKLEVGKDIETNQAIYDKLLSARNEIVESYFLSKGEKHDPSGGLTRENYTKQSIAAEERAFGDVSTVANKLSSREQTEINDAFKTGETASRPAGWDQSGHGQ